MLTCIHLHLQSLTHACAQKHDLHMCRASGLGTTCHLRRMGPKMSMGRRAGALRTSYGHGVGVTSYGGVQIWSNEQSLNQEVWQRSSLNKLGVDELPVPEQVLEESANNIYKQLPLTSLLTVTAISSSTR